jgi:hypothetical protein
MMKDLCIIICFSHGHCYFFYHNPWCDQFNQRLPSIKLATNSGTLAKGLEATTFCTRSGFEANPNPIGKETDITGSASRVWDMIAVARLGGSK